MTTNEPHISCLCLTENRVSYLRLAIDCFLNQSYPNKELVILYRTHDTETQQFVALVNDPKIKCFGVPSTNITLGELRNISIEKATGDYFCQWDDDDWYHRDRLRLQMNAALKCHKDGSLLKQLIFFDKQLSQAYFSFERPWENTVLCRRSVLEEGLRYKQLNKQEDSVFMAELLTANKLAAVSSYPTYIYVYHGHNTWARPHFEHLFSLSQRLSDRAGRMIGEIINGDVPVPEASEQLLDPEFLGKLDFFYSFRKKHLER